MTTIFRAGLFADHVAIVTGGGTGIGLATARTLAELGAKIAICGRREDKLLAAKNELETLVPDVKVLAATCDIRDTEQVAAFVDGVIEKLGHVTVLINNAGGQFPTTAETVSQKGWEAVIRNNLNGTFFMTQVVAQKSMIPQKRGRVVNVIANIERGFPGMVHTGAARAGVDNLTKTLAVEWAQYNIQVNAVAPGIIKTAGTDQYPPELIELSKQRTLQKRLGTPEECAELIAYLSSEAAWFVTGETYYIDGGAKLWGDLWVVPSDIHFDPPQAIKSILSR